MAAAQPVYTPPQVTPTSVPPAPPLNQLSTPYNPSGMVPMPQATTSAPGGVTVTNGVATRTIDPATETTAGQLDTLMNSSSPLEQLAQSQGMNAAAARGSANGTLFAGAEQAALNSNLAPIASQDAQVYERGAQSNEDALNQKNLADIQRNASITSAGIGANASMYNADVNAKTQAAALAQNQNQFSTNWANTIAQTAENQNWTQQDQATQNEFALKGAVVNGAVNTIFSDPSYWNNPAGSLGMINDYSQNIGSIIDQMFPPNTYGQTPTQPSQGVPQVGP